MKSKSIKKSLGGMFLLALFAVWTVLVCRVDVQPIGPMHSVVGFATVNRFFHHLTGVHMALYTATDWLSLLPVGFVAGFGLVGLMQWIRRKHIARVDADILVLGGFYIAVAAVFILFEEIAVNYRPVLIDGILEASYPSSTTMLVLCVMPTAALQLRRRIRNPIGRKCVLFLITVFSVCMVIGRLISGVHWVTDIIGGILLSGGLVTLYDGICQFFRSK